MKTAMIALGILCGVPLFFYGAALWVEFWITRSFGQWIAIGIGVPLALAIAVIYVTAH
jgi:hypothetical protein